MAFVTEKVTNYWRVATGISVLPPFVTGAGVGVDDPDALTPLPGTAGLDASPPGLRMSMPPLK
jgi:hypothetical protein